VTTKKTKHIRREGKEEGGLKEGKDREVKEDL